MTYTNISLNKPVKKKAEEQTCEEKVSLFALGIP